MPHDRPAVSVVTPAKRPVGRYLAELHAALDAQAGVEWEWLIQLDGGASLVRRVPLAIRRDPRVAVEANGRWFGQGVTRNLALVRARHELLQTVDADDLLYPGALAATATALEREPALALAFGRTWELRPDGEHVLAKNPYPPGRLAPGTLTRDWERRGGSCSVVVGSAMWRTACVRAEGGWPASVAGLDVLLLLAVTALFPARVVDADTYVYRSHPEQMHRGPTRFAMRPHYRALARQMTAARAQLGYAADGPAPAARAAADADVPGS